MGFQVAVDHGLGRAALARNWRWAWRATASARGLPHLLRWPAHADLPLGALSERPPPAQNVKHKNPHVHRAGVRTSFSGREPGTAAGSPCAVAVAVVRDGEALPARVALRTSARGRRSGQARLHSPVVIPDSQRSGRPAGYYWASKRVPLLALAPNERLLIQGAVP